MRNGHLPRPDFVRARLANLNEVLVVSVKRKLPIFNEMFQLFHGPKYSVRFLFDSASVLFGTLTTTTKKSDGPRLLLGWDLLTKISSKAEIGSVGI